jgi:alginate O-acetyltransferase complex protein AlgI
MNFTGPAFFCFLFAVVIVLRLLPTTRLRMSAVILASYLYYASWSVLYLPLLAGVGLVAQQAGKWALAGGAAQRARRAYVGVAALMVVLVLFRSPFVLTPVRDFWVRTTGIATSDAVPLGLSFYVFEAISYLIEVSRGREKAYSFWDFQLFIGFFPHLLSGPIMKAKELIGQFDGANALRPREWAEGLWRIASGLFLKIVFADELAVKLDPWFHAPEGTLHASDVVVAGFGFATQMYCDFAGYTSIAIGAGLLCGVRLIENFNSPFLAKSPADFWNRWHISLSRWIRDYVFLAFVGKDRSLRRFCEAAILSMVLCGLWHAVSLKFLVWGLFHGCAVAGYHVYRHLYARTIGARFPATERSLRILGFLGWGTTLIVLFPGWILFRTEDLGAAMEMLGALAHVRGRAIPGNVYLHVGSIFACLLVVPLLAPKMRALAARLESLPLGPTLVDLAVGMRLAATLIVTTIYTGTSGTFVYFQF